MLYNITEFDANDHIHNTNKKKLRVYAHMLWFLIYLIFVKIFITSAKNIFLHRFV